MSISLTNTIANCEAVLASEEDIKEFKATVIVQVVTGSGSRGWNLAGNEKWRAELGWEIGQIILHHLVTN